MLFTATKLKLGIVLIFFHKIFVYERKCNLLGWQRIIHLSSGIYAILKKRGNHGTMEKDIVCTVRESMWP